MPENANTSYDLDYSPTGSASPSHLYLANHVVVVEQDEATRDSIAVLLEARGYAVGSYASMAQFLAAAAAGGAAGSCVILDSKIDESTEQVLELLERARARSPIILYTGLPDPVLRNRLEAHGHGVVVLRKPVGGQELLGAVRRAFWKD